MAAYEFVALEANGRQKKGVLEADSGRQIRQMLRDQGLTPLSVDPAREAAAAARSAGFSFSFGGGMSALDQALFTRQLATLIAASLPIEEALRAVSQQSEKSHVRTMILGIRARVLEGHSLAASLGDYPQVFSNLYAPARITHFAPARKLTSDGFLSRSESWIGRTARSVGRSTGRASRTSLSRIRRRT